MWYLASFGGRMGGGENCNKKVGLRVIAVNMLLSPCRKNFPMRMMFHKSWNQFKCLQSRIYLIWHPKHLRAVTVLNIPLVKQYLFWTKFLQLIFPLCFSIPYMIIDPMFYAAVMTLWLVAFPSFLIISVVSGIVNVMSLVVPAAAFLLILGSLGSRYNNSVGSVKSRLQNVKSHFDIKITSPGSILASGWLPVSLHDCNGLKSAHRGTGTEWHIKDSSISWLWCSGWKNTYDE